MFSRKIKVYLARGMTGRIKEEVVKEAIRDKEILEKAGFEPLCPVTKENVRPTKVPLSSDMKHMKIFWPADKKMIQQAHVVFDMSPHLKSEGVSHELGLARYAYWKKVVRVFPKDQLPVSSSVAYFEDDAIVDNIQDAIIEAYRTHGSWIKRFIWRVKLYNRCLLHHYFLKLLFWVQ
jgi:hypothetical protein